MNVYAALPSGRSGVDADDQSQDTGQDPQRLSLRQIWYVLRRNGLLLAIIVAATTGAVIASQLMTPPTYRAVATVQVELNDGSGANQAEIAARNQQRVANEARIYRSQALEQQVVRDLRLDRDPRFMGEAKVDRRSIIDHAAARLGAMTNVTSTPDSDFIDIAVQSRSPEMSANIANQFIESLQKLRINRRNARKRLVEAALDAEQTRLADEAVAAERAVAAFRGSRRMLVGAGGEEDYSQVNRIAVEAASAVAMRDAALARAGGVASAVGNYSDSGESSPLLQQQQRQHDDLLRERSKLGVAFGAGHPEMRSIDAQLEELGGNLRSEQQSVAAAAASRAAASAARERGMASAEAAGAAARARQLEARLRTLTGKAFANTTNAVELAGLERRAEISRQAFLKTAKQAQEVKSELETTGVNSSLISSAVIPDDPVAPNPKRAGAMAFTGSVMLGLLLVFAKEMFDNKLRHADQVRTLFGLPTFAMLPRIAAADRISTDDNPLIDDPQSLFAEVARSLSAEVAALAVPGRPQSVLITSPLPGDGKSTVAMTLVAAAASMGRRAIVVDLDLRRPTPSLLQLVQRKADAPDLVDYLAGHASMGNLLALSAPRDAREVESYKPIVLSTREQVRNPASLLGGTRVRDLIGDLRERFDLIVINAPATLAVRDARTLMEVADSTLMVLQWGQTTQEQMRASLHLLQNQVHGAVFNKVDYVEHARRGYGDAVQFYVDAAAYYQEPASGPKSLFRRLAGFGGIGRRRTA